MIDEHVDVGRRRPPLLSTTLIHAVAEPDPARTHSSSHGVSPPSSCPGASIRPQHPDASGCAVTAMSETSARAASLAAPDGAAPPAAMRAPGRRRRSASRFCRIRLDSVDLVHGRRRSCYKGLVLGLDADHVRLAVPAVLTPMGSHAETAHSHSSGTRSAREGVFISTASILTTRSPSAWSKSTQCLLNR